MDRTVPPSVPQPFGLGRRDMPPHLKANPHEGGVSARLLLRESDGEARGLAEEVETGPSDPFRGFLSHDETKNLHEC